MARFKDPSVVPNAFEAHLEEGEEIKYYAYGVKQPSIWLIILLMCLAILPGIIAIALLTKEYIVALTGGRFLAIRFSGSEIKEKEFLEYQLGEIKDVKTSKGVRLRRLSPSRASSGSQATRSQRSPSPSLHFV
jgi:hypothetical protein